MNNGKKLLEFFIGTENVDHLYILILLVILDYITGICVAIHQKRLSSKIGFKGISLTLISTHESLPSQFLRTPKSPLRRKRRKNNFGVLTSRYVGAACCPHIVDRSVCENWPKTLLKKAVVSSLPSPLTPNRPAALQSSSKALEIRQQSVGCFRSFFTCFAHQHHPPK